MPYTQGIGDANLLIQNCIASASTSTAAIKSTALGEGYFMRAYNYLRLVSQYGGVPLQLTPDLLPFRLEFTRAAPKDVYAQISFRLNECFINCCQHTGAPYAYYTRCGISLPGKNLFIQMQVR